MSLWGSFTGSDQKKRAEEAYQRSTQQLQGGWNEAKGYGDQYYGEAQNYLKPYQQQGGQANALYGRYLGLNGRADQQAALDEYAGGDPFRAYNASQANRAIAQKYNAMGFNPAGGTAALALSRANLERGSQDYNSYLDRLGQMGQQGYGAAGAAAGMASDYGNQLFQGRMGLANTQAGNEVQRGNALAQADGILANNLFKIGGLALGAYGGFGNPSGGMSAAASAARGAMAGINYVR